MSHSLQDELALADLDRQLVLCVLSEESLQPIMLCEALFHSDTAKILQKIATKDSTPDPFASDMCAPVWHRVLDARLHRNPRTVAIQVDRLCCRDV